MALEFIVTKASDAGIEVVAQTRARSIRQAMNKLFGEDWEVHNVMGYLIVGQPSTGTNHGCLWIQEVA